MALVRWEPVRELHSMQQEMNRLFNTFFDAPDTTSSAGHRRWVPAMDLVELEDHFVLRADLPGLDDGVAKLQSARSTHLDGVREHFLQHFTEQEQAFLGEAWTRVAGTAVHAGPSCDPGLK